LFIVAFIYYLVLTKKVYASELFVDFIKIDPEEFDDMKMEVLLNYRKSV